MAEEIIWRDVEALIAAYGSEEHIARRLKEWRLAKGWSLEQLARELKKPPIGHYSNASSLWKMENPDDPKGQRRPINISDALAIARVFNKRLAETLLPDNTIADIEGWTAVIDAAEALNAVRHAWYQYTDLIDRAQAMIGASATLRQRVQSELDDVSARHSDSFAKRLVDYNLSQRALGKPEITLAELVSYQEPTPLLAALEDALAKDPIRTQGWAENRHWVAPDDWEPFSPEEIAEIKKEIGL
jgi:transcriptional regulator with XRE-family HTH domain